jgi:F0F1-type ATP synthase membrane subunit b/b'
MATDSNRPSATSEGTSTGQSAKEVANEAGSTAKKLGQEAMHQAKSTGDYLREQARTSVEESKNQVAEQVGGLAKAFHKGSEELRNDELARLADQGEWLAGRVEELQQYLQERSASELLDDLRGIARTRPAVFLGGLFAAGLMTARFLHSSEHGGHGSGHGREQHGMGAHPQGSSYGSGAGQSYQARNPTGS